MCHSIHRVYLLHSLFTISASPNRSIWETIIDQKRRDASFIRLFRIENNLELFGSELIIENQRAREWKLVLENFQTVLKNESASNAKKKKRKKKIKSEERGRLVGRGANDPERIRHPSILLLQPLQLRLLAYYKLAGRSIVVHLAHAPVSRRRCTRPEKCCRVSRARVSRGRGSCSGTPSKFSGFLRDDGVPRWCESSLWRGCY